MWAELVAVVSDDPAIEDEDEREAEVRDRVRAFGGDALAVYAADKVSKVRELRLLIITGLPARSQNTNGSDNSPPASAPQWPPTSHNP